MKNGKFLLTVVVVLIAMMAINYLQYGLLMKDFYKNNSGVSAELYPQFFRDMSEMNMTAGILSGVAAALLLTSVLSWGGFTSAASGARAGAIVCMLTGIIMDFGMMSFLKMGTMTVALTDIVVNIVVGLILGAIAGTMLGRGAATATA